MLRTCRSDKSTGNGYKWISETSHLQQHASPQRLQLMRCYLTSQSTSHSASRYFSTQLGNSAQTVSVHTLDDVMQVVKRVGRDLQLPTRRYAANQVRCVWCSLRPDRLADASFVDTIKQSRRPLLVLVSFRHSRPIFDNCSSIAKAQARA